MRLSQRTEEALVSCMNAVAEPALWSKALQQLGKSLGAESCTFCSRDLQQLSALVMPVSTGHEEFADLWFRNEAHAPDPHFILGKRHIHKGQAAVLEHQLSTEHERRTHPYYQETARPAARDWWAISSFMVSDRSWCFPVYRSDKRGPFTPEEAQYLAIVGPRIALIISMAEKFAVFQTRAGLSGLEQARCAAFVIDFKGHVLNMNRRAEELLGDDLRLSGRRLVLSDPSSNLYLQRLVGRSVSAGKGNNEAPAPILVECNGEPWCLMEAVPMTALVSAFFSAAKFLLLVTKLKASGPPDESVLRNALGLTPAEVRLAHVLSAGHDLEKAVAILGIKMPTARSQLRSIFSKTNTRRQAELMSLMARLGL